MTRIDSSTRLAASVRRGLPGTQRAADPRMAPAAAPQAHRGTPTGGATSAQDIAAVVACRVRALDPADPDRPRQAFRAFLTAVLLAELGGRLADDPGFGDLVLRVQREMEADAALAAAVHEATQALLAGAP